MRIFDIPRKMEHILQAIEDGSEPDPEIVRSLVEEGPVCVDAFCHAIMGLEEGQSALDRRIRELRDKRNRAKEREQKMRQKLREIVEQTFNGKIETYEFTVWVQDDVLRIRK